MQLNTLNVETLRDVQRHPERHKNLVVRVWGRSGYFCEFDETYQNQIIGRTFTAYKPAEARKIARLGNLWKILSTDN
jgi:pyruvate-formate lyase